MIWQENNLYEFGPFRLAAQERLLTRDGEVIPLAPKAVDLLVALVENSGHVISKEELMKRVWPDSFVEEANLSHHIFTLRKALGEDKNGAKYIETIPRRGYRFVASVTEVEDRSHDLVVAERVRSHIIIDEEHDASESAVGQSTSAKALAGDSRLNRKTILLGSLSLALLVGLTVVIYIWMIRKPAEIEPTQAAKTIAVLPFKPLVADSRNESLELGMADTLITKLSSIRQLIVRPTSAVRKYSGLEQDPIAAGRELGVEYVVEGNLQTEGETVRATVRLLRVNDGAALWTDKCDQACSTIFELQDAVALQVAGKLEYELSGREKRQLAKHYTENTEAYQLYLQGRYHWYKWKEEEWKKAQGYFLKAIEKDPGYALAYAGLADAYGVMAWVSPPGEAFLKMKGAVLKALELDDTLPEAHLALSALKIFHEWDRPAARDQVLRALELNPNSAQAHNMYAIYLGSGGQIYEAIQEQKRAQELEPLSPYMNTDVGMYYYYGRQYDKAIEHLNKALEIDPDYVDALKYSGAVYEQQGMHAQAIAQYQRFFALSGDQQTATAISQTYAKSGYRSALEKWLSILTERAKTSYVSPMNIAGIYARLGDNDRALEWMTKAYEERSNWLIWLKVEPGWDGLRSDPRFTDLLNRVGLIQ